MFWLFVFVISLVTFLIGFWPLLRGNAAADNDADYDIEVYRDQHAEVSREREQGLISAELSEQAQLEISRRLLAAEASSSGKSAPSSALTGQNLRWAGFAWLIVPVAAIALYQSVGSPEMKAQPFASRQAEQPPIGSDMAQLVERAEAHLASNPDDGRGWDVIAPVYLRMDRIAEAADAYRNALRINGASAARLSGLGEASVILANGTVSAQVEDMFRQSLALQNDDERALFFIGLASFQRNDEENARRLWQTLSQAQEADPQWRTLATEYLAGLGQTPSVATANSGTGSAPRIDDEAISAAGEMSAQDRTDMIASMVDGLEARLADEPNDLEGWKRLLRALVVLDQDDRALRAMDNATAAFARDADGLAALTEFAGQLGLTGGGMNQ